MIVGGLRRGIGEVLIVVLNDPEGRLGELVGLFLLDGVALHVNPSVLVVAAALRRRRESGRERRLGSAWRVGGG